MTLTTNHRSDVMPIEIGGLKLWTVEELAQILDVQERTIRSYLRGGKLRGRKLARRWYVTEEHLREYFSITQQEASNE